MREVVGQERLGRATGFSSMAMSMGLLLGPVLGGVLYEYAGYFQTFVPALALLVVELVLRMAIVEGEKAGDGECSGDKGFGEEEEGSVGDEDDAQTDVDVRTAIAPNPTTLESQPLLPQTPPTAPVPTNAYRLLLASPRFLTALLGLLSLTSIACGFDAVLPPYLFSTFSLGPASVAALFLALALPMLFAPLTGLLTDRLGAKPVAAAGLAVLAPSLSVLALVGEGTQRPMLVLGGLFVVIGVGMALVLVPLQVDAVGAVGVMEREGVFGEGGACGRAVGLVNGMVAAGGLVGPLAAGFVRIRVGWEGLAVGMGGLSVLVFGGVVVWTGGRKR